MRQSMRQNYDSGNHQQMMPSDWPDFEPDRSTILATFFPNIRRQINNQTVLNCLSIALFDIKYDISEQESSLRFNTTVHVQQFDVKKQLRTINNLFRLILKTMLWLQYLIEHSPDKRNYKCFPPEVRRS